MDEMSKYEMVCRIVATAKASTEINEPAELIVFTSFGMVTGKLVKLVANQKSENKLPIPGLKIALSNILDDQSKNQFSKIPKEPFIFLSDVTIFRQEKRPITMPELILFLSAVEGFSLGHVTFEED